MEIGLMIERIQHVHDDVNIGAGLAALRQGRTIDDLEGGTDKVGTKFRKCVWIQITTTNQNAAIREGRPPVIERQLFFDPLKPLIGIGGKTLGGKFILLFQVDVNVIKINKQGRIDLG
jgi:hypothetical protein